MGAVLGEVLIGPGLVVVAVNIQGVPKAVACGIGVVAAGSHFARGVFPVEKIRQGLGDMVQIFHSLFRNFISRTPCNDTGVVAVPVAEVNHVPFMPFVKGFVVDAFFGALQ